MSASLTKVDLAVALACLLPVLAVELAFVLRLYFSKRSRFVQLFLTLLTIATVFYIGLAIITYSINS